MPYDPLSPDRKPQCYRTLGPDHYDHDGDGAWNTVCDGCLGSDCSAWRPQVRVTFRPRRGARRAP